MSVVITGGDGFLGWHTACRLRALRGIDAIRLGRAEVENDAVLAARVRDADAVLHLAGVNRAQSDAEVRAGNVDIAQRLATAMRAADRGKRVVYANSIQARTDTPYGRGKAEAARILNDAASATGGTLANVLLPNLFGEHGRPQYNSFVATFCESVAGGAEPKILQDNYVPLLHVQRAAAALIEAMDGASDVVVEPAGEPRTVSAVLVQIQAFHEMYQQGDIPPLEDDFSVDLFNTYRSYPFPSQFPRFSTVHADARGELFEAVRSHGGTGQTFVSTTRPGRSRGDHYHLRKFERFCVVRGTAQIELRRLLHDEVVTFVLDGDRPGYVDMPTMWVHNISNIGHDDLVTVFWSDQLLDQEDPDQYPERVRQEEPA